MKYKLIQLERILQLLRPIGKRLEKWIASIGPVRSPVLISVQNAKRKARRPGSDYFNF